VINGDKTRPYPSGFETRNWTCDRGKALGEQMKIETEKKHFQGFSPGSFLKKKGEYGIRRGK
jgi:hypothetical protein